MRFATAQNAMESSLCRLRSLKPDERRDDGKK
jgi:hypothetical protein